MTQDRPKRSAGNVDQKFDKGSAHQEVSGDQATGFNFGNFSGTFVQRSEPADPSDSNRRKESGELQAPAAEAGILFLAANPTATVRLRMDEEARKLSEVVERARANLRFVLHQVWAARAADLLPALLQHRPVVLHFSGHGSLSGGVVLEDGSEGGALISGVRLGRLLGQFSSRLRCVFLNACFSETQAKEIAESIDCVIGSSGALEDQAAITFAGSFYCALAYGCSVREAFELAKVDPAVSRSVDEGAFRLICKRKMAESVYLVGG